MNINFKKKYNIFVVFPIYKIFKKQELYFFGRDNFDYRSLETKNLVKALNSFIVGDLKVNINSIKSANLFTDFSIDKILLQLMNIVVDVVVIDTKLSPIQQRNLEKIFNIKVIDRTQLIIEIFGLRASSKEGKLQVELASLNFQKTRLVRSWTHLERQRGGSGFLGGPGESQIEIDKRLINKKIKSINKNLKKITQTRHLHKSQRDKKSLSFISLVGYTNSGKSTLFNQLTNSKVLVKDMPFATLDPTVRSFKLNGNNKNIIFSDTVGFISSLPIELINSFHSTLDYIVDSNYLIIVHDISDPKFEEKSDDVIKTLKILGLKNNFLKEKVIHVFNKKDLVEINRDIFIDNKYNNYFMMSAINISEIKEFSKFILNFLIKDTKNQLKKIS